MLLIEIVFRPYVKLDILAIDSGIRIITNSYNAWGDNGRPLNFWNDSTTIEHLQIKWNCDGNWVDIFE